MYLEEYQEELKSIIKGIKKQILASRKPILNPYNISIDIKQLALEYNLSRDHKLLNKISDRIRKFHDFYGWMSRGSKDQFRLCSGTFYRTAGFLNVIPDLRSGKKYNRMESYGIHVEHAIPINIIRNILIEFIQDSTKPKEIYNTILKYSLCVAFTRTEEKCMIKKGFHKRHPQTGGSVKSFGEINAFSRYRDDIEIISMVTGKKVSLDSKLGELTNSITKDLNIFTWQLIESNYPNKKSTKQ